ncbi:ArsR/SmtB family transcription factor [Spongiimicrobium sp. 3-5]|uniref:ArsR/SmtB family transcription factor n=1 Tax=Spongiimicrobium sp. 3-5 TaxID=3332596 RepID=UPI00397FF004
MDIIKINKALSNQTRLNIFGWLKDPDKHFPPHKELGHFDFGVCVLYIQEKAQLSQSTISHYLSLMQQAELVIPTRIGKWTYYKRNEDTVKKYAKLILEKI